LYEEHQIFCFLLTDDHENEIKLVRFEVFTAVTMKSAVFWDVALCRSCVNRCFGGTYHFHPQDRKNRERGTSLSRWLQASKQATFSVLNFYFASIYILNMKAVNSSEISVNFCQITQRRIQTRW
jgi:hypothetical protein